MMWWLLICEFIHNSQTCSYCPSVYLHIYFYFHLNLNEWQIETTIKWKKKMDRRSLHYPFADSNKSFKRLLTLCVVGRLTTQKPVFFYAFTSDEVTFILSKGNEFHLQLNMHYGESETWCGGSGWLN